MDKRSLKRGVLLQALGHNNYYQMAVVLAASIKVNDSDIKICLITDNEVSKEHQNLFDIVLPPSKSSIYAGDVKEYIKAKLYMYNYSPFEETLFLDVDQVLIEGKKLTPIFEELKNINLTFSNTGLAEKSVWAEISEVQKLYGKKPFWNFHSELVYFKKTKEVKNYFHAAIRVYEENKITSATRFSQATMADELAFQCASIITGIYPHKENWTPNFWFDRDHPNSRKYPYELSNDYTTYSIGGNTTPKNVKNNYNILANYYFAKLNLLNPYQVVDKRNFLPERNKI